MRFLRISLATLAMLALLISEAMVRTTSAATDGEATATTDPVNSDPTPTVGDPTPTNEPPAEGSTAPGDVSEPVVTTLAGTILSVTPVYEPDTDPATADPVAYEVLSTRATAPVKP